MRHVHKNQTGQQCSNPRFVVVKRRIRESIWLFCCRRGVLRSCSLGRVSLIRVSIARKCNNGLFEPSGWAVYAPAARQVSKQAGRQHRAAFW